jgi:hypothetical protein
LILKNCHFFHLLISSGGIEIPHEKGERWKKEGKKKSLGAVLETYDKKDICDFPEHLGIKFDIKTKRYKSIEMMFQKRIADQINLASDDIFD